MTYRRIVLLLMVMFAAIGTPNAWALSFGVLNATKGPSSLTVTVLVSNEDTIPGTSQVFASDIDFLVPTGSVLGHYIADAEFVTGSGDVVLTGFVDTANTFFGTEILIGSATESTVPFTGPLVPFILSGPYALTLTADFTLEPGASLSFTHTVSVLPSAATVPEPASAVLLATGLLLVGVTRWCSRRRQPGCPQRRNVVSS